MKRKTNKLYYFLKCIFKTLMHVLYKPTIIGKENIPKEGAIIFAGNHRHAFDPLLILMSNKRMIHYLAKEELFKGLSGKILNKIGMIKVSRDKSNSVAIEQSEEILKNGGIIGIFPEGTRNRTNEPLLEFKYGTVSMAKKTGTIIIPFAIRGKYKLFRKGLALEYGAPLDVAEMEIEEANTRLRAEVLNLIGK